LINEHNVTLTPLLDEDVKLFEKWLEKDYIYKRFCPEGEEEREAWLDEIKGRHDTHHHMKHFIVSVDEQKIGFCLCIDLFHEPEYVKEVYEDLADTIRENEAYELGYLIGEEIFLNKGLGKIIIKKLEDRVKEMGGKMLLADPSEENIPSIKVLTANGFQKVKDEDYRKMLLKSL